MDRGVLERAGSLGLLVMQLHVAYGGAGLLTYFLHLATDAQKVTWLPELTAGRRIGAVAISEPDTGSDLAGIRTRAVRDGDYYVLSGQETFISSGLIADSVIVAARTVAMRTTAGADSRCS
jgi:alkylation response protein AidB-like acyl-CoA dehydrogenase